MSVFVVLGLIWAAVLVPPVLRARAERRAEFIDSFRAQMGALGKKSGVDAAPPAVTPVASVTPVPIVPAAVPPAHARRAVNPVKRRRDILGGLLGAIIGSLLIGAVPSLHIVWALNLFLVNVFIGYLALLAHQRRNVRLRPVAARHRVERQRHEPVLAPVLHSH